MNNMIIWRNFSILLVLAVAPALRASEEVMTGRWTGSTHVIVTWCKQQELPVSLEIQSDGSVTGKIGDAELLNAHLKKKRNWFGQEGGQRTTHIVEGELKGAIVAAEGISRKRVFIHLRIDDGRLFGGVATSGSKVGGKDSMILTTTSLHLARSQ